MTTVLGPDTEIAPLVRSLRAEGSVALVPAGADKAETLARFGEALGFPDWYGLNYDAMFDCLLQHVHDAEGVVQVVWDGTAAPRTASTQGAANAQGWKYTACVISTVTLRLDSTNWNPQSWTWSAKAAGPWGSASTPGPAGR